MKDPTQRLIDASFVAQDFLTTLMRHVYAPESFELPNLQEGADIINELSEAYQGWWVIKVKK